MHPRIPSSIAKMKTTLISLCLITLFTISSLCVAQEPSSPTVVDSDGDALRVGAEYYVSFFIWPIAGGVGLASPPNQTCPQSVVHFSDIPPPLGPRNYGLPVTFHPIVEPEDGVIRQGMYLNIRFPEAATPCPESNVWKVDNYDSNGRRFLTAGGEEGNSIDSLFKIEAYAAFSYKFVHCTRPGLLCTDVGRYPVSNGEFDGASSRLALQTDEEVYFFAVVFIKKQSESLIRLPK